ncbi:hypothetical protein B0H34DRAFT_619976, partial [Crassisporium funariophilum]
YLNTGDAKLTGNLWKHAKLCFGDDTIVDADGMKDISATRKILAKNPDGLKDGLLSAILKHAGKTQKVTYSHRQHTKIEANIVADCGFLSLMKTGQAGMYIPSPTTVARNIKQVFAKSWQRIAKMLQEHNGALHFGTNALTTPNHKAYVALTVHFELNGEPVSMLLDLVEVAQSHSGANLAAVF